MLDSDENDQENRGRVSRVIISKVNDKGEQQLVDYEANESEAHTEVLRIQAFGFSNNPPEGSEGIVLTISSRDHGVLLGIEHPKHRPKDLPPGSSQQYDKAGSKVFLDGDGNATIQVNKKVLVKGENIELEGATKIKGNVTIEGDLAATGSITDGDGDGGA